ncbi:MAG: hypothetical protein PHS66_06945 [Candidatus Omnitrophica bacterium]|nr:hypothetical protein [Candidatus Omnitrophota bacterium]
MIFDRIPLTIKIIGIVNTIINFLLLVPLFSILQSPVPSGFLQFFILGLTIIIFINIIFGVGVILLMNLMRKAFIVMQIIGLVISIAPAWFLFTIGLGSAGSFGDNHTVWAPVFSFLFWQQLSGLIFGMMFPGVPMLFSMFCIFYLTRSKVREQFK